MFTVAGVSTFAGKTKVRYANDMVSRVKILIKSGHADINIMDLPLAMTKLEAINYLKTTDLMQTPRFAEAIQLAYEKYSDMPVVRVSNLSIDAIKARAGITSPEAA